MTVTNGGRGRDVGGHAEPLLAGLAAAAAAAAPSPSYSRLAARKYGFCAPLYSCVQGREAGDGQSGWLQARAKLRSGVSLPGGSSTAGRLP